MPRATSNVDGFRRPPHSFFTDFGPGDAISPVFIHCRFVASPLRHRIGASPVSSCKTTTATWFIGAYVHDFRVLTQTGRLAEVNYYQHGGEPFLAQGQTAVLYPPVYLGVALAKGMSGDWRWTIEWIAAEHLTMGLLGFYFWARQNGVSPWLAALGGLAWVLNPFILIVTSRLDYGFFVAAWLPWLFGALDRLWIRPSCLSALFSRINRGSLLLQGYVQWTAYAQT